MKNNTKKVKRRFNYKRIIFILLLLYIVFYLIYSIFTLNIKNIYISGLDRLTDNDVIVAAKIKNYPPIFKTSKKTYIERITKLKLVKDIEITRNFKGTFNIDIVENKMLFLQKSTNQIYLENGSTIEDNNYLGVPLLINYVPEELFNDLVTSFGKIDNDIIKQISEIEYSPYKTSNNEVIDSERFILRMNDGNTVYVNLMNIKKLNYYEKIYLTLEGKGNLYLDSEDEEKSIFSKYEN